MEHQGKQQINDADILKPKNYEDAVRLAQTANNLCFVFFTGPNNDDLPGEFEIHHTFVDDYPKGIDRFNWEAIDIDISNPNWYHVGEQIRGLIDKSRWDKDTIYVLLDMEKTINDAVIDDVLMKVFSPIVEEKIDNFILPARMINAIKVLKQSV